MKKLTAALLIILCFASIAAAFGKKGVIPEGDPIAYKGLRVTQEGVSLILINKGDKPVVFNAALTFVDKLRKDVGDTYIDKTTIEPHGEAVLKDDYKACKGAETIRWTIYALESN